LKSCRPDFNRLDPVENDIDVCSEHIPNMRTNAQLLQFRDGGDNLLDVKLSPEEIYPFFRDFTKVFEAIVLLQEKKIAHSDIKLANIVYKRKEGGFDFHVIDFGLSTPMNRVPSDFPMDAPYPPWPYEIKFTDPKFKADEYTFDEFTYIISSYLKQIKILEKDIQTYDYTSMKPAFTILKNLEGDMRTELALLKLDTYSLGVVLLELFTEHVRFVMRGGIMYRVGVDGSFSNPMAYKENSVKEAYTNIEKHVVRPLYELLRGMMNLNFAKRLFAVQALSEYKKLVAEMEKYLTPNALKQVGGVRRNVSRKVHT
jgi:serine/threonine protein kinase